MQNDAATDFLSQIELYGKPVLGGDKLDLFGGGFNKDQLAKFWLGKFAPFAIESAANKRDANRVGLSEGAIGAFEDQEQRGEQAYGQFGGNPELFLRGQEQRRAGLRGQLAQIGAGAESEYTQDVFSSIAGASQQAGAAVLQQKSLDQQRYLADQARKAIRKAQKSARRASYIQAAGAVLSFVGGVAGSAAAGAIGAGVSGYAGGQAGAASQAAQAYSGGAYPGLIGGKPPSTSFWGNNWGAFNPFSSSGGFQAPQSWNNIQGGIVNGQPSGGNTGVSLPSGIPNAT